MQNEKSCKPLVLTWCFWARIAVRAALHTDCCIAWRSCAVLLQPFIMIVGYYFGVSNLPDKDLQAPSEVNIKKSREWITHSNRTQRKRYCEYKQSPTFVATVHSNKWSSWRVQCRKWSLYWNKVKVIRVTTTISPLSPMHAYTPVEK
jgi:hypothetical protein